MHGKTMREALQEARNYRDPTNEGGPGSGPQKGGKKQSSADIKKAYGILNDPRYKQGNYSGAAKAIDKLSPGLSNHPDVKNAMKRANEELEEERTYTVIHTKHGIEKSIKANGTYDAAQKYAKMKGLKDTSGVNAHLNEELEEENRFSRQLKGRQREVYDLALKDIRKNKVYGEKDQDAVVDKVAGTSLMGKSLSDVKQAIQHESLDLSATGDTTTSNASQENEIVESLTKIGDFEYALRVHMVNNLGLSADAAANKIKKYKHLINKSMGVVHTAGMLLRKEDLDEAAFSQTQIDALKQKYSGLRGSEKNGIQMDKLAKIMKRYPKDHLNQLAKLDIPMVSKVAKAMTEETFNENWQYEMEIEYGDSMDDDQETIVVFGNVRGATLESQADRKYEQLEKQMQKKYGRDAMIDGGTMKGKTNDRSRGGSNPIERKDI